MLNIYYFRIWYILRDKLHIRSINVPTRKAPPPPGTKIQHPHRFSLNAFWGNRTSILAKTPESPTNGIFVSPLSEIKITLNPVSSIANQSLEHASKNTQVFEPPIINPPPIKFRWNNFDDRTSNNDEPKASIRPLESPPPIPSHKNIELKSQKKVLKI